MQNSQSKEISLGVAGALIEASAEGLSSVLFGILGTWSGTILFEGSCDGITWHSLPAMSLNAGVSVVSAQTNGLYFVTDAGLYKVRARMSAYTSGTATVIATSSDASIGRPAAGVKFASISIGASGANTAVAAVAGRKIRVLGLVLMPGATVSATVQSGAGGTTLIGGLLLGSTVPVQFPYAEAGWCETAINTLLNINLSSAVAVGGCVVYVEV